MAVPIKTIDILTELRNRLEPAYLLYLFLRYPPQGFRTQLLSGGQPAFSASFNLLTTMDPADRRRIERLPLQRLWSSLLVFKTLFVGSTVSEFVPLAADLDAEAMAAFLVQESRKNYPLVIVKDLPQPCPLMVPSDAATSQSLFDKLEKYGFIGVAGQALAYVPVDYASLDDYLARFSRARRKDFRRKLRVMSSLKVEVLCAGDQDFYDEAMLERYYAMYVQVYAQSDIHFDRLDKGFFRALLQEADDSLRFVTYRTQDGELVGYNICFVVNDMLVDKYIGFDYPAATSYNLYFVSWFYNLEYARQAGLKYYIAGWTDPQVKAYLGAQFVMTRHAVYIRNPLLRGLLKHFRRYFESDTNWHQQESAKDHTA